MTDDPIWTAFKLIINWIWVPLGFIMAYIFKDYIAHKEIVNDIEDRLTKLEIIDPRTIDRRVTTLEVKVGAIEESLKRIEIKVDKIMDYLLNHELEK